jgi:hypothetical protein
MQRKKTKLQSITEPREVRPDAAGIDISAEVIDVAVDPRKDLKPIRHCGMVTAELYRIANWLKACGVRTVAMESTGMYWIGSFRPAQEIGAFRTVMRHRGSLVEAASKQVEQCRRGWIRGTCRSTGC